MTLLELLKQEKNMIIKDEFKTCLEMEIHSQILGEAEDSQEVATLEIYFHNLWGEEVTSKVMTMGIIDRGENLKSQLKMRKEAILSQD